MSICSIDNEGEGADGRSTRLDDLTTGLNDGTDGSGDGCFAEEDDLATGFFDGERVEVVAEGLTKCASRRCFCQHEIRTRE